MINKKQNFCLLLMKCIRSYKISKDTESFNTIVNEYGNLLDEIKEKEQEITDVTYELQRVKINSNVQNKKIATELLKIYQEGINKVSGETLKKEDIINYYKYFLEELNK